MKKEASVIAELKRRWRATMLCFLLFCCSVFSGFRNEEGERKG